MPKLFNLARMTTATVGTGTITLGSAAVIGGVTYLTFAQAGVSNGDVVYYGVADPTAGTETGYGTYTSAGTFLSRNVISSTNSNAAISLSGSAQVFVTPVSESYFAPGTQLTFIQSSAPVGWTRNASFDDAALRIVGSATPSSGGTNGFSTVMAQTTVGNHTLSIAEMPSHSHSSTIPLIGTNTGSWQNSGGIDGEVATLTNTGGGGAHNHTLTMSMKYVDALIASKN